MILVEVLEDVLPKLLDCPDDVPSLLVLYVLVDVVAHPSHHLWVGVERLDHLIDRLALHLVVVEIHAQVGRQVQFVGEVAKHALKEGVDRLHAKEVVVMGEQRECLSRVGSHSHRSQPRLLHHLLHIGVRPR